MKRSLYAIVILFALTLLPAIGLAVDALAGPYRIGVSTDPAVIPVGSAKVVVHVSDSKGQPVKSASVRVFAQMPGMPMGEREQMARPVRPGTYEAPAVFAMGGGYGVRVSIDGPAGKAAVTVPLETGQDTGAAQGGFPVGLFVGAVLVLVVAGWLVLRLNKLGVRPDGSSLRSGRTIGSLLALAIILVAAVWAVNNLRRPGAMTPMGAQGMEMSTPPPPGSAAVTVAEIRRGTVESTVRYTGQAVGYVEQDVLPRVTGTLVSMPLYVGDKVHRGQVLARLDTTQLEPQVVQKQAMADAARQGVGSAQAEYDAATAMVKEADAEHGQFMSAIEEAGANLSSAQDNEAAMAAQVTASEADADGAQARRRSAQADLDYWSAELARMDRLFKAGAVSRDEYQQTVSQEAKARAAESQMAGDVRSAQAKVSASKAADRQAKAGIVAAQHRLDEANNQMLVHHAHVASARAMGLSAKTKVAQAVAGVRQAEADLASAAANEGYAIMTSPIDGVVTQRNVTQGTLVQPGTSILRIAQIDPIRLQANVPSSDLERIRVGARVRIRTSSDGVAIEASVTSVSPSVDAAARTGVVEALVSNPSHRLLPGQFVSMEISTGLAQDAPMVPNAAIQMAAGSSVWVAEPAGEAGQYTVHQVAVKLGASDGHDTAVLEGLREGQTVVTSGFINLAEGIAVTAPSMPSAAKEKTSSEVVIGVTATAFVPTSVTIPAGEPARVTFLRRTAKTCATEVVFPELGIRKALPLNQAVTLDLGPTRGKTYNYTCGLGMFPSKVVVH